MPRLRRVSPDAPGWTRRRSGRGFRYLDVDGRPLAPDQVERVKSLVIPPAWRDVWICPDPNGHLQATGVDAAGRRQYLYHPAWRVRRDRQKFERVLVAAELLPGVRELVNRDLALEGMPWERACATAVRLLDLGLFRIGNDYYADAHGSFGLTTLERRHVRVRDGGLAFRFVGKSGVEHRVFIEDQLVVASVQRMRYRRGGRRLLAYRGRRGWTDLTSADVNSYLAELFGGGFTAKDFRTWHASVIAAEALALTEESGASASSRQRAVRTAVKKASTYLGNTPAMARSSYIDPRVLQRYDDGVTIADAATRPYPSQGARQEGLERAVLELLRDEDAE